MGFRISDGFKHHKKWCATRSSPGPVCSVAGGFGVVVDLVRSSIERKGQPLCVLGVVASFCSAGVPVCSGWFLGFRVCHDLLDL